MIISERQIMQLINQLKDRLDLLTRIGFENLEYRKYLVELCDKLTSQQCEELKVIND